MKEQVVYGWWALQVVLGALGVALLRDPVLRGRVGILNVLVLLIQLRIILLPLLQGLSYIVLLNIYAIMSVLFLQTAIYATHLEMRTRYLLGILALACEALAFPKPFQIETKRSTWVFKKIQKYFPQLDLHKALQRGLTPKQKPHSLRIVMFVSVVTYLVASGQLMERGSVVA